MTAFRTQATTSSFLLLLLLLLLLLCFFNASKLWIHAWPCVRVEAHSR
jgi:hypothetical protein